MMEAAFVFPDFVSIFLHVLFSMESRKLSAKKQQEGNEQWEQEGYLLLCCENSVPRHQYQGLMQCLTWREWVFILKLLSKAAAVVAYI